MPVKNARRTQPDTYFKLVKEFPLTRILGSKARRN